MTRYIVALAVGVLVLAAGLRLHALDAQSFWNDEGSSYGQALRTPAEIAVNAAADIHPPGYYWLLAGWRVLTGESELALRMLSVLASLLSGACAFALGRRLYGCTAGLVALAAVTVNTFSIYYAQEARMYALLALWGAASTWALVVVLEGGGRRAVLALALTTAAGLYTNYAFAGVLAMHGVMGLAWLGLVARSRALFWRLLASYGLALALFAPWLPTALRQVTTWGSTGLPIPPAQAVPVALGYWVTGITYPVTGISTAAAMLLVMGVLPTGGKRPFDRRALWAMLLPVVWAGLTLWGFLALGLFRPANLKFLLPAQLAAALLIGRGAWAVWHLPVRRPGRIARYAPRFAALMASAALMLGGWAGLDALYNDPQFRRDDYRAIVQAIAQDGGADAAVILNGAGQREVFEYTAGRMGARFTLYPLPVGLEPDRAATEQAVQSILAQHPRVYGVFWGTAERDPQGIVEAALAREAYPLGERWYGSVRLARYLSPVALPVRLTLDAPRFTLGDASITLLEARLSSTQLATGDTLALALTWAADAPIDAPVVVTVQLLDADGRLVAQRDSQPANATRPLHTWAVDEPIIDRHALAIPNDLAPAQYRLIVALYTAQDMAVRLPVAGGDAFTLANLTIGR